MTTTPPPTTPDPNAPIAGADALTEHARWLIDFHANASNAIQQRAMSFLGVAGVLLGLVLTALALGNASTHTLVRVFAVLTVLTLIASSTAFAACLSITTVTAPGVDAARTHWNNFHNKAITADRVSMLIANDFLADAQLDRPQPLQAAQQEAHHRARWLKRGLRALLTAFALLTCLIISVLFQPTGGESNGRQPTHSRSGTSAGQSAGPVR